MRRLTLAGTLMLQDTPCCKFVIDNDVCESLEILCDDTSIMPFGCDPKEFPCWYQENLVGFFYDRTTEPTAQGLTEELPKMGLKYYDMSKIIIAQSGTAMSDPYWIRFPTGPQTYTELLKKLVYRR